MDPQDPSGPLDPLHDRRIAAGLQRYRGDADAFAAWLKREDLPHLSYTQISTLEFCQYRYYLEYIEKLELDPQPAYFAKGRLFHRVASQVYQAYARQGVLDPLPFREWITPVQEEHRLHLLNAVNLLAENAWAGWTVVAIEEPFVMSISPDLPPCVGVIDLILRRGDRYAIVDHKTGGDFYQADDLQMVIYREYVRRTYPAQEYLMAYDHYRWVNNLRRIRKPAFQRRWVNPPDGAWDQALERFWQGFRAIQAIRGGRQDWRSGPCYRCPYRRVCPQSYCART